MNYTQLVRRIREQQSFLCVGLDTHPDRLPDAVKAAADPVLAFNRQIIEATQSHCVAYKINTAFYEAQGETGWHRLQQTAALVPDTHFCILDAKRGDIGNTSRAYAEAFWPMGDALTVAPYMGSDSVQPFLEESGKWVILLALTSNASSTDFQLLRLESGELVYEAVVRKAQTWGTPEQLMFVVGATRGAQLERVRELAPKNFLLVPGVGAQGGSLREVVEKAMTPDVGLLINASRSIIYASSGADFAEAAGTKARRLQQEMQAFL